MAQYLRMGQILEDILLSCRYIYPEAELHIYQDSQHMAASSGNLTFDWLEFSWLVLGASASGAAGHFNGLLHHFLIIPGSADDLPEIQSGLPGVRLTQRGVCHLQNSKCPDSIHKIAAVVNSCNSLACTSVSGTVGRNLFILQVGNWLRSTNHKACAVSHFQFS